MPVIEIVGCVRLDYKQIRKIRKTRRLEDYIIRRLEIMKLDYLEMLHTEFEVCSSNNMAVRAIIRAAKKKIGRHHRQIEQFALSRTRTD